MESPNAPDTVNNLAPQLTPRGHLLATPQDDAPPLAPEVSQALDRAFALGSGHGLLLLGTAHIGRILPPAWAWWRDVAARYVTALCATPDGGEIAVELPTAEVFEALAADAPPMTGAEYLTPELLAALWHELDAALHQELAAAGVSLQAFLKSRHPAWNLVGRVHFNLAENRKDAEAPFAFLATYTTRLSAHGKAQHLPLSQALAEYSGGKSRAQLLSLLLPVQRAAEHCDWLREMVEAGEIYHPLRWSRAGRLPFLTDLPQLEAAGISRAHARRLEGGPAARARRSRPAWERAAPSLLGQDALLDFSMEVTLDGENAERRRDRGAAAERRWPAVASAATGSRSTEQAIGRLLERFKAIEQAAENGLPFAEAMRLLAGASLDESGEPLPMPTGRNWPPARGWPRPWPACASPRAWRRSIRGRTCKATLRPYQQAGVRWLYLLTRLGLGACLADDMGLGKTIQVLSLLLVLKREDAGTHQPSLLVAPASLLANWAAEIERFAPACALLIAHPSAMPPSELQGARRGAAGRRRSGHHQLRLAAAPAGAGRARAGAWPSSTRRRRSRTPAPSRPRRSRSCRPQARIALTGTPVENRLSRSVVDLRFPQPGPARLGQARSRDFAKRLAERPQHRYGPLRALVRPYILRRLKTDKRVIADLPDKTEVKAYCRLSPDAGGALPAGGRTTWPRRWKTPTASQRRGWCWPS